LDIIYGFSHTRLYTLRFLRYRDAGYQTQFEAAGSNERREQIVERARDHLRYILELDAIMEEATDGVQRVYRGPNDGYQAELSAADTSDARQGVVDRAREHLTRIQEMHAVNEEVRDHENRQHVLRVYNRAEYSTQRLIIFICEI
jgi:hypothetical protein